MFAILVTNYFADKLIESLTVESPKGTQIYLMNNEGEFLYHPDPKLSFGFEFNKGDLIPIKYQKEKPEVSTIPSNAIEIIKNRTSQ